MSYFGGAWNSLKFSVTKGGMDAASSLGWSYKSSPAGSLTFKNNRAYKIMLAHVAKREAMQIVEAEINKLFPKYQRYLEKQLRETVLKQQDKNHTTLIKDQKKQIDDNEWGCVTMSNGSVIYAHDKYGAKVPEALMMHYDGKDDVITTDVKYSEVPSGDGRNKTVGTEYTVNSKTLLFIDLAPHVTVSSAKNIVMSTVQGRDFTRKELVSGGDLKFNVSGIIVSDQIDVYPDTLVQKFIQMCQYGGVISVNHFIFKQFNVDKMIITDYSLGDPECKNEQPYSFSCVAVEPDEDVQVTKDTIAILNKEIELSPMNKWYKFILDSKLAEIAANMATSAVSSAVNAGIDSGINALAGEEI